MIAANSGRLHAEEETHLRQHWQAVRRWRRWAVGVALACTAAAVLWALQGKDVYRATTQLLVEREDPSVVSFRRVTEVNERGWSDEFYQTQHKMVHTRAVALSVIRALDLLQQPEFGGPRDPGEVAAALAGDPRQARMLDAMVQKFLSQLDADWLRGSRLIDISFEAQDPALAARVANQVAEAYVGLLLDARRRASAEAAAWLAEQIDVQRGKVAEAERALQAQRDRERLIEGIVNVDDRRTLVEQRLKELATARTQARTRRLEREALYEQMKAAPSAVELPDVLRSPVVAQMRIDLANLERRMAFLSEKYLDRHPEVVRVRNQIEETKGKIEAEAQQMIRAAENDAMAARAQERSLDGALEDAKREYGELSLRAVQYEAARRDLEAARAVLAGLTTRYKETDVTQELRSVYVRVLDPATVPREAAGPRRWLKLLVGLAFGLVCSIGLAIVLETLDDSVRTPADVQRLSLPLLSVVPEAALANGSLPGAGPLLEPGRLLRANLEHALGAAQGGRVVLVTSTGPGEGKTLNAVNLAASLARQGGRVLLVDADLRQAAAGRLLGCGNGPGLAELLAGRGEPEKAVRRSAELGADVLPAGGANAEDLVSAAVLRPLLGRLRASYEWIVVDAPPVGPVADALVMAPLADGTVLVVQAERVPLRAAAQTAERLAQAGARVLGVVLNRAPVESYPYDYGFHYGRYERAPDVPSAGAAPPS